VLEELAFEGTIGLFAPDLILVLLFAGMMFAIARAVVVHE